MTCRSCDILEARLKKAEMLISNLADDYVSPEGNMLYWQALEFLNEQSSISIEAIRICTEGDGIVPNSRILGDLMDMGSKCSHEP